MRGAERRAEKAQVSISRSLSRSLGEQKTKVGSQARHGTRFAAVQKAGRAFARGVTAAVEGEFLASGEAKRARDKGSKGRQSARRQTATSMPLVFFTERSFPAQRNLPACLPLFTFSNFFSEVTSLPLPPNSSFFSSAFLLTPLRNCVCSRLQLYSKF